MGKQVLFALLIVFCINPVGYSQNKIVFQLQAINPTDSLGIDFETNFVKPKTITLKANPLSVVTDLVEFEGYNLGLQFEILKSKLQNKEHLIVGMSFYKKKKGTQQWDFVLRFDHWPVFDSKGELGSKGILTGSFGFTVVENGREFNLSYELAVN
jgi:hypothetical protein